MSHSCCTNRIFRGEAWACFLLRMWIGIRLTLAGVTKFLTKNEEGGWEFSKETADNIMGSITGNMKANTPMTEWMLNTYASVLPWTLIIVGCWVIVGLFSRCALIVSGFIILSLSFGLLLLPEDVDGTLRAIEILVIALALMTVKHNILAVDNLVELALGGDKDDSDSKEDEDRKKD